MFFSFIPKISKTDELNIDSRIFFINIWSIRLSLKIVFFKGLEFFPPMNVFLLSFGGLLNATDFFTAKVWYFALFRIFSFSSFSFSGSFFSSFSFYGSFSFSIFTGSSFIVTIFSNFILFLLFFIFISIMYYYELKN